MPPEIPTKPKKKTTGRKVSVVRDELSIKGSGLYCYLPFNRLDRHKKAVFKIGMTTRSFANRLEQYHTYFPSGVYMCAFLENPPIPRKLRSKKETPTKQHYLEIEKFILNYIDRNGGERIYSTTRVKNANQNGEGQTEWTYTDENTIHDAFTLAEKKYGGKLHLFYLEGLDPETGKFTSINQEADASEKEKQKYVGKIIFHL